MFVSAARAGSFSAAARQLNKVQSAISTAIGNLELDLGVQLFDRTTRNPTLTPEGEKLLADAEAVLRRCAALEERANHFSIGEEPKLALAIEVPYQTVVEPLFELAQRFPHIDVLVRQPSHGDVSELVCAGEVELGIAFARTHYPDELSFIQMGKLVMSHVVSYDHPLAMKKQVSFADLREHRRLVYRAHINRLPTSEYLGSAYSWEAESFGALLEMVRAGLGWTSLPRRMMEKDLESGQLVELSLEAYPHPNWLIGVDLLWSKGQRFGAVANWFQGHLQKYKIF